MMQIYKILSFILIPIILGISVQSITEEDEVMAVEHESVINSTPSSSNNGNQANYLFVQSALSGSLVPINSINNTEGPVHKLTLNNISSSTLAFSDRPDRIVNITDTKSFVDNWINSKDSFEIDPPNAALSINVNGTEEILALELLNPSYSKEQKTIQYNVINLDDTGTTNIILSNIGEGTTNSNINSSKPIDTFGTATLFIDSGCNPLDPRGCK